MNNNHETQNNHEDQNNQDDLIYDLLNNFKNIDLNKKKSFITSIPLHKRIIILRKIAHWKDLDNAQKRCNITKGANLYAFEYLKQHLCEFVRISDVQEYCNKRTKEVTGKPLGDPPRAFEILRKDKLPLEWDEIIRGKNKYVKYNSLRKNHINAYIINNHIHKNESFDKNTILQQMEYYNYKCAITGIPEENGKLAADHFIPKEKGGLSIIDNCVIINKILNEKKNKKMPINWFCESLLTNFMNICKKVGILDQCKKELITFIQDFI